MRAAVAEPDAPEWINGRIASEILGRTTHVVVRLADLGHIRRHQLPGAHPRYYRPDCERLAPPSTAG